VGGAFIAHHLGMKRKKRRKTNKTNKKTVKKGVDVSCSRPQMAQFALCSTRVCYLGRKKF
jgi:hypothetical protein